MIYIKIPKDRIGALIGPKGAVRKQLETRGGYKIDVDTDANEVVGDGVATSIAGNSPPKSSYATSVIASDVSATDSVSISTVSISNVCTSVACSGSGDAVNATWSRGTWAWNVTKPKINNTAACTTALMTSGIGRGRRCASDGSSSDSTDTFVEVASVFDNAPSSADD